MRGGLMLSAFDALSLKVNREPISIYLVCGFVLLCCAAVIVRSALADGVPPGALAIKCALALVVLLLAGWPVSEAVGVWRARKKAIQG